MCLTCTLTRVQTDMYTDVFPGAGHAASGWQNQGWTSCLKPREENDLGLSESVLKVDLIISRRTGSPGLSLLPFPGPP